MNQHSQKKTPEQMVEAIFALDLDPIKFKLMDKKEGHGWSREQADRVELEYKRFLALLAKYPEEVIAPNTNVDKFWHGHILDTMKYAQDCQHVFGYFLHHFPYFGLRDEEDAANLAQAAAKTKALYEQEFGAAQAGGASYCAKAASSYCAKADDKAAAAADAAYCARAADASYCAKASVQASAQAEDSAAYCAKADVSYCARASDAAQAASNDAAYCARSSVSYCAKAGVTAEAAEDDSAYCAKSSVSYCARAGDQLAQAPATQDIVTGKGRPKLEPAGAI